MYLLPKIHKDRKVWPGEGKVPPGRPIIADCSSKSHASAKYIDNFLAPLAKQHKSYLKDTNDFKKKNAGIKAKEGAFIATIDVDSLYTNTDNTNGLEWYQRTWGTLMGKKFAPNHANLFWAEWEEKTLAKCVLKPPVYWMVLDDICMI